MTHRIRNAAELLAADGRVAGVIFYRRNGLQTARLPYRKSHPTAAQSKMQLAFKVADLGWQALDETHKDLWRAFRKWQHLYGYNQYMRVNITRARDGLPFIDDPANIP